MFRIRFEIGFYIFTNFNHQGGWQWVGDHIRPRARIPEAWKWPVGVSLSLDLQVFGFAGVAAFAGYSLAIWQMSIRYRRARSGARNAPITVIVNWRAAPQ